MLAELEYYKVIQLLTCISAQLICYAGYDNFLYNLVNYFILIQ
jgi:hypothetical protein